MAALKLYKMDDSFIGVIDASQYEKISPAIKEHLNYIFVENQNGLSTGTNLVLRKSRGCITSEDHREYTSRFEKEAEFVGELNVTMPFYKGSELQKQFNKIVKPLNPFYDITEIDPSIGLLHIKEVFDIRGKGQFFFYAHKGESILFTRVHKVDNKPNVIEEDIKDVNILRPEIHHTSLHSEMFKDNACIELKEREYIVFKDWQGDSPNFNVAASMCAFKSNEEDEVYIAQIDINSSIGINISQKITFDMEDTLKLEAFFNTVVHKALSNFSDIVNKDYDTVFTEDKKPNKHILNNSEVYFS